MILDEGAELQVCAGRAGKMPLPAVSDRVPAKKARWRGKSTPNMGSTICGGVEEGDGGVSRASERESLLPFRAPRAIKTL